MRKLRKLWRRYGTAAIAITALVLVTFFTVLMEVPISTVQSVRDQTAVPLTGFDLVKSWWLGLRLGLSGGDAGGEGVDLWKARLDLSPHDPAVVRGYIDALIAQPRQSFASGVVPTVVGWAVKGEATAEDLGRLLRLHQLEFITDEWGFVSEVLRSQYDRMSESDRDLYLWIEADAWNWAEVEKRSAELESRTGLGRLVLSAWAGGKGKGTNSTRETDLLSKTAKSGEGLWAPANRLLIQVGMLTTNLPMAQEAVERLKSGGGVVRLVDQIREGRTKVRAGMVKDLGTLMSVSAQAGRGDELEERVLLLQEMGNTDRAMAEFEEGAVRFVRRDWWVRIAERMILRANWKGLDRIGRRLGKGVPRMEDWRAFASGLRWIAAVELGETEDVAGSLKSSSMLPVPPDRWAFEWATMLARQGRLSIAMPWLLKTEETMSESLPYWKLRMRWAFQQADASQMLVSVRRARRLDSTDVELKLTEAEMMIIQRESPEGVLALLDGLPDVVKGQHRAQVCRVLAISEQGQTDEVPRALNRLESITRADAERAMLGMVQFEVHRTAGRIPQANAAYQSTDRRQLPRVFAKWMEKTHQMMGTRTSGKTRDTEE